MVFHRNNPYLSVVLAVGVCIGGAVCSAQSEESAANQIGDAKDEVEKKVILQDESIAESSGLARCKTSSRLVLDP